MKILKTLLFVVIGLVVIGTALVLLAPNEFEVKESLTIEAPHPIVYRHVAMLEQQHAWNPWNELDPDQEVTFSGDKDGSPGYKYEWTGPVNGKGYQQLVSVSENAIEQDLVFIEPWASENKVYFNIEETEGGTKVTWTMKGEMPAPMNAVMMFSDMGMSSDFQKGLQNLKAMVEEAMNKPIYRGYEITTVDIPATRLLGLRQEISMDDMQSYIEDSYKKLYTTLSGKHKGIASGLYYTWDMENNRTDMMPALAVDQSTPSNNFQEVTLEGKAVQITMNGDYQQLFDVHMAIEEYFKDRGIVGKSPAWEEYTVDANSEPDTSKWVTKVTYFY